MGTLYLVRHGQASFGSDDYDRLSPLGQRQSQRLGGGKYSFLTLLYHNLLCYYKVLYPET